MGSAFGLGLPRWGSASGLRVKRSAFGSALKVTLLAEGEALRQTVWGLCYRFLSGVRLVISLGSGLCRYGRVKGYRVGEAVRVMGTHFWFGLMVALRGLDWGLGFRDTLLH